MADSENMNKVDRTKSMEKELTRSDFGDVLGIPSDWPMEEFPPCHVDRMPVEIMLKDEEVPSKTWRFLMRKRRNALPGEPEYEILKTGWKFFVEKKKLRAGDKIVIKAIKPLVDLNIDHQTIDLNKGSSKDSVVDERSNERMYRIRAQRKDPNNNLAWVNIQR